MLRVLFQFILWGGLVLGALAMALYGWLWLPYREPEKHVPMLVDILPETAPADSATSTSLETYGWVDRSAGVIHMPIDVAMQVMLERLNNPDAAIDAEQSRDARTIPTDAGSGRFVTRKAEQEDVHQGE